MVGNLNTRITINVLATTKDAGGGVGKSVSLSYSVWAAIENRTGQANFSNGQRQVDYDYKITIRSHASRTVTTANTITYQGKNLKPISVQKVDEGKNSWLIIKAQLHGGN